jgi:hypothetical protein
MVERNKKELINALTLLTAIVDEGTDTYLEQFANGEVTKALQVVDNFIDELEENA